MADDLESMLADADETEVIIIRRFPDGAVEVDADLDDEDDLTDILLSVIETINPSAEAIYEECDE